MYKYLLPLLLFTGCSLDQNHDKIREAAERFCRCQFKNQVVMIRYFGSAGALVYCDNMYIGEDIREDTYVRECR